MINNDSLVRLGNFIPNIKLVDLLDVFSELFEIDYIDEIIQELNEENESFIEDMFVVSVLFA